MGLLTPKNNKSDKKSGKKNRATGPESKFIRQQSKPTGITKKPVKTGGSRGS